MCPVWFGVGEADLLAASVAAMKEVDLGSREDLPPGERRWGLPAGEELRYCDNRCVTTLGSSSLP